MAERSETRAKRDAFASWLCLTDGQRAALGQPSSRLEWATAHSISDRQLRRWENEDPTFAALLASKRTAVSGHVAPGTVTTVNTASLDLSTLASPPSGVSGAEQTFNAAWATLMELIAAKDKDALRLYFTSPQAKALMEAQLAEFNSDFRDLDDTELATHTCRLLSADHLAAELGARGWKCTPPTPPPAEIAGQISIEAELS